MSDLIEDNEKLDIETIYSSIDKCIKTYSDIKNDNIKSLHTISRKITKIYNYVKIELTYAEIEALITCNLAWVEKSSRLQEVILFIGELQQMYHPP